MGELVGGGYTLLYVYYLVWYTDLGGRGVFRRLTSLLFVLVSVCWSKYCTYSYDMDWKVFYSMISVHLGRVYVDHGYYYSLRQIWIAFKGERNEQECLNWGFNFWKKKESFWINHLVLQGIYYSKNVSCHKVYGLWFKVPSWISSKEKNTNIKM